MIRPRVGHINFLNILPLTWAYRRGLAKDLSIVPGVPAEINALMKNNLLDVSMMSSIEYARQSENLLLLPDVCIRAKKDVTSIILLSKKPIEKLHGEKVLITTKSATAHCLLKIILSESYGIVPEYATENLTPENPVPGDAAAALFIGDDALYLYLHEKSFGVKIGDYFRQCDAVGNFVEEILRREKILRKLRRNFCKRFTKKFLPD